MTTTPEAAIRKKLIEVSIPLEDINTASARENYIYKGNPSSVHKWWAQRPLATARAVLFSQLVDDPSSDPALTQEQQKAERERLHGIIRRLVVWENMNDESLLREAYEEILKSTGGNPPVILDPFAGGGSIPLEAQRLGLETHASDLNPVAVLINKALIEIPPKFAGRPPIYPGVADTKLGAWPRATGLAEDVRRYGAWMRDRAAERIGHCYPDATIVDEQTGKETKATALAWIWARTVTCPNPACGINMPLVRSWWLGRRKGQEAYVVPTVVEDAGSPNGRYVRFSVGHDKGAAPKAATDGTVGRLGATCVACASAVDLEYVRAEGRAGRVSAQMMAIAAEGVRRRIYLPATASAVHAADIKQPTKAPSTRMPAQAPSFRVQAYGMLRHSDLFTNRQLVALTTFSDLVDETRTKVLEDAFASGLPSGPRIADGGDGAEAYADAVATYLGMAIDKYADYGCTLAVWYPQESRAKNLFARQTIPMTWDYPEISPFGSIGGTLENCIRIVSESFEQLGRGGIATANLADAASRDYANLVVSTDPPYYNNIGYSDLSDFFYIWLRRSLREIHPALFASMLVPKAEELVANSYRHGGRGKAEEFFQKGFEQVFARARQGASDEFPITVYYAFKQAELAAEGITSTGWATILEGIIREGWAITATWPVRTERAGRMISVGTNALASSIVLVLRPRHQTAGQATRRGFIAALRRELPEALEKLREGAVAPVDLTQATIGPGMAVFSRYERVVENDGSNMSVKAALRLINQALDEVLAESEGDLDADTRFCLKWYEQYGWGKGPFGDADLLARSYDTSVRGVADSGVITQGEGIVQLVGPTDMSPTWNPLTDHRISAWEVMCHLGRVLSAEDGGVDAAATFMAAARTRTEVDIEAVQRLAYRLYETTKTSRPDDARLFNLIGGSWTDLTDAANRVSEPDAAQAAFDFEDES